MIGIEMMIGMYWLMISVKVMMCVYILVDDWYKDDDGYGICI